MYNRLVVGVLAVALCGCGGKRVARVNRRPIPPAPARSPDSSAARSSEPAPARSSAPLPGDTETGVASWYGHPYHGRQAANGEVYDMEALVAAHRTLPFDTWVRVVNLRNDKAVEVRVIDRGPFIDGRIIDLSHAAARAIDLIGPGTARVRVEILSAPVVTASAFAVQVGAFRDRENAERMRARMESAFGSARMVLRPGEPAIWRILVGTEPTEESARVLAARIRAESGERTAFILRLDSSDSKTSN